MAKKSSSQIALITGASAGIGRGLALQFARNGYELVLVARRQQELTELAGHCQQQFGVKATVLPIDLLAPDAISDLVSRLDEAQLEVDVLVNNAGCLAMGRFAHIPHEQHERQLQLNTLVLASLTHHLLQPMLKRGKGRILNVASISAFQPVPSLALYAATKAFVLSFTESLSEELKGTGVSVTALCPGFTRTDMLERGERDFSAATRIPKLLISDVDSVARVGYQACVSGQPVAVPGMPNRVITSLTQLYPRWLVRSIGGVLGRSAT